MVAWASLQSLQLKVLPLPRNFPEAAWCDHSPSLPEAAMVQVELARAQRLRVG